MEKVSVIIINYNTAALTERCIQSVYDFTNNVPFEIIVVDNNSEETAIDLLPGKFPDVKFKQLNANIGFGKACNIAAQKAEGAYIFFLNPDTFFQNNALKMLLDFYVENEEKLNISCLGVQLSNAEGNAVHSAEQFPEMKNYIRNKARSLLQRAGLKRIENSIEKCAEPYCKVDYVTGAAMMISKRLFESVRGFDHAFFLYFEETDLQYRLAAAGRQSYLLNGPSIVHFQGASTEGQSALLRSYYYRSMHLFFKKHNSKVAYSFFSFLWFFLDIKTVLQSRKSENQP